VKHLLFIIARVEYLRHDVELMVVVLSCLDQLRTDIKKSQASYMRGLKLLRKQIFHDEHVVLCAVKDETSVEFMRPLLNSWAECSVVISCGKVDYDKSG
jgi:hypothetical protein